MPLTNHLTAMILTFNEQDNIARTLDALGWVEEILVVDSGSTDATAAIVARYPKARLVVRPFDTAAAQCNFGLAQISTDWVLSLDADYEVSLELAREIAGLAPDSVFAGYSTEFVYRQFGNSLKGSLYPPRTVLYRKACAVYRDHGHTQRVHVSGAIGSLRAKIFHDDRKPLARWFASQQRYAQREADYLLALPRSQLRRSDRFRLMAWPAPIAVFFYTLLWKRCLFDGWHGWLYVLQRTYAETMIAIEIVDRRLRKTGPT